LSKRILSKAVPKPMNEGFISEETLRTPLSGLFSDKNKSIIYVRSKDPNFDPNPLKATDRNANYLQMLDNILPNDDYKYYKSKYPNVTLDDLVKRAVEMKNLPIYKPKEGDEDLLMVLNALGFTEKEQIHYIFTGENLFKEVARMDQNGEPEILWDNVIHNVRHNSYLKNSMEKLKEQYLKAQERKAYVDSFEGKPVRVDWYGLEKKHGEGSVMKMRDLYMKFLRQLKPLDVEAIVKKSKETYKPVFERVKDDIIDKFNKFDEFKGQFVKRSFLLQKDKYGLPLIDVHSFEYMDEYEPELRDEVIDQIERGDLDVYYKAKFKKVKSFDDYFRMLHLSEIENRQSEIYREEEEKYRDLFQSKTSSETENKSAEVDKLLRNLKIQYEKNKQLEGEINALKAEIETASSSGYGSNATVVVEGKVQKVAKLSHDEFVTHLIELHKEKRGGKEDPEFVKTLFNMKDQAIENEKKQAEKGKEKRKSRE